jgi:hypothetical protein
MPIKPAAAPAVVEPIEPEATPAPVYQPSLPDKAPDLLLTLVKAALARTDSQLAQWAGGNTQFEATRFMLNGQFTALRAVALALEGDPKALEGL